jgi:hypothetical protein
LLLARGRLVFYGPPAEAQAYFQVARFNEIYDRLAQKEPEAWEQEFRRCTLHQEFVHKRLAPAEPAAQPNAIPKGQEGGSSLVLPEASIHERPRARNRSAARPYRPPLWHQFCVLTTRYAELLWGDPRSLRLLFLQAPVVALVILLGFSGKPYADEIPMPREMEPSERRVLEAVLTILKAGHVDRDLGPTERAALERIPIPLRDGQGSVSAYELIQGVQKFERAHVIENLLNTAGPVLPGASIVNPRYTYMLLFLLAVTVLWFGCNNAAKEIVKEEAIYGRERAVNLGILPYLGSKFLVLTLVSAVQTFLLMGLVYGGLALLHELYGDPMPFAGYRLDYGPQYGVLLLLAMTGVALGLLLSACVSTPDRANSLLPYVLIPQIILGGGIMSASSGLLYGLAAIGSPVYWAFRAIHRGASQLPHYFPGSVNYSEAVMPCAVALAVQMGALLLLTTWFLRRKDLHKV